AMLVAAPATGATWSAGGGADYSSGPGDQTTRSVTALACLNAATRLTLGAMRYDDTLVGTGNAGIAVAEVPLARLARVQIAASRFIGQGPYRAWRFKAGPGITLPSGSNLGVYYVHFEEQDGLRSDGATGELA